MTAQEQKKIRKQAREKLRRHTPIEKKESMRWIAGVRQARDGRECPDMPCDVVFHASEWKAVCMVNTQTEAPDVPPSLTDMICWIAAMGGHVIRSTTKAKHPGTQTLWLGLQRVNDLAIAWNSYGPGKITPPPESLIPKKRCVVR